MLLSLRMLVLEKIKTFLNCIKLGLNEHVKVGFALRYILLQCWHLVIFQLGASCSAGQVSLRVSVRDTVTQATLRCSRWWFFGRESEGIQNMVGDTGDGRSSTLGVQSIQRRLQKLIDGGNSHWRLAGNNSRSLGLGGYA